jgi:DNA-binding MarR family transcriptional regulator
MIRIVAGLARSRFVEITGDAQDARRMRIRPTAKGVKLLQQGRERRISYLASHLAGLSQQELAQIAESTNTLSRLLQAWT